jgi:tetratricopeptide (TPR) repeat protein
MRKFAIPIIALALLVSACSSSKKTVVEKPEVQLQKKENQITENQKIEFEFLYIEGLKQKVIGTPESAIQYFNGCLEINPNSAAALYELANIYSTKGELTSAKLYLQKAIQINPENKWYKLLLAQIYQNSNQFNEASKIYNELIKAEPDNVDYYFLNALLLTSAQQYDLAIKAYNQLEDKVGYNEQIALARQNLFRTAKKNKEAYLEIEKLIKQNPTVPEYYGILADMYKEDGNQEKALANYNKVLEMDSLNGFVHFSLASYYIQNKNIAKAIEHAEKGFSNPEVEIETKIQLYMMLVSAPSDQKIPDEEIEKLIQSIIQTHPTDSRSYSIQADHFVQQKRLPEARQSILKALEINPNTYPIWEQLIITDNQLEDFENMVLDSKKGIELFPTQPLLYVLNSVALIQLKDYKSALDVLEKGIVYVGDNKRIEAQFELYKAEAFYNLNEKEKSYKSFEKVIEIDPNNFLAMNNYAYYLSIHGEELEKAELLSSQVVKANPDNATYLDTHAWVLFKKKEYRLAKFYMETAIKNGGNENAVVIEHYGDILYMLNDVEGAVSQWKVALEKGSQNKVLPQKISEKKYFEGEEE